MSVTVRWVPGPPPAAMRAAHLAALDEPQELYLERRVASGATWLFEQDRGPAGYAVIDSGRTLLELFHEDLSAASLAEVLRTLTGVAGVKTCLYQSFDARMVELAAAIRSRIEPVGILFRGIRDPHHRARPDVSMRQATQSDLAAIAGMNDGFFADDDEIRRYLDMRGLSVLESSQGRIIGCGLAEPVMPNGTDIDIGMLVAPDFRRRGYGTFIVSHLKFQVLSKGLRPICGCAIENAGSQRAIQNAGFAPDHRLLRFDT